MCWPSQKAFFGGENAQPFDSTYKSTNSREILTNDGRLPPPVMVTLMRRLFTAAAIVVIACALFAGSGNALDLNSFRAQHGLPPLSASGALSGAARSHALNLAGRQRLDHSGFRQRVPHTSGAAAENVAFGCATEDCVIRMWAKSGRHRANMLRRDVTRYGLASADGGNGRRYWVLELGN
jgi:Cysteine-rich secretory protein family